jgi:ribonucleoside-diphosphate reductase alpha chain
LGSLNLVKFIKEPFSDKARLDEDVLDALTRGGRLPDDMRSMFPIIRWRSRNARPRPSGASGLVLPDLQMRSSCAGPAMGAQRPCNSSSAGLRASGGLPIWHRQPFRRKGDFPLTAGTYLAGATVKELDDDVRAAISAQGIRNALLTSIAPTGTISLLARCSRRGSSQCLPMPTRGRSHRIRASSPSRWWRTVYGFTGAHGEGCLPAYFVNAQDLPADAHIAVQAAAPEYGGQLDLPRR